MGAPGCPTPTKKGYKTPQGARQHMWSLLRKKGKPRDWQRLHVYRCGCGLYHVGHSRKSVL